MAADKDLASQASAALVAAAASPDWAEARQQVAALLGRYDQNPDRMARRLDALHTEVVTAAAPDRPRTVMALQIAWQTRLSDLLDEQPEAASDVRSVAELANALAAPEDAEPHLRISSGRIGDIVDLGGVLHVEGPGAGPLHIQHEDAARGITESPGPGDPDLDL